MHPFNVTDTLPIMRFFDYEDLPEWQKAVVKPFADLARDCHEQMDIGNDETVECLRRLLDAKEAAVRATILEIEQAEELFDLDQSDGFVEH